MYGMHFKIKYSSCATLCFTVYSFSCWQNMIAKMVNEASAGIYGIQQQQLLWWALSGIQLMQFWRMDIWKNGKSGLSSIYSLTKWICVLYAVFCSLIMLTAPEIMWIVAPSSYHEGTYLIPPIIAATYFSGLYTLFGNVELFYKK